VHYELCELKAPYWFNNDEVARIQELNLDYMAKKELTEMIEACKDSRGGVRAWVRSWLGVG
jgi:hypothetical protein